MPNFTFARANAGKLASAPLYAFGWIASLVVRRRPNLWVFACGSGVGEGALELYNHAHESNRSLRLVWLARDRNELAEARRVGLTVALRSGWRGFRLTLRAGVIVVTHGLGDANRFGTRGAYIVQLWHGIPLKKIQLDSPTTFRSVAPRLLRTLYRRSASAIDFVPAASPTSAARLRSAFGLPESRVAVTGDPRDDVVLRDARPARELLAKAIGDYGTDRIILFAPTWRDGDPDPVIPTRAEWEELAAFLESTASVLVIRPHPHSASDYHSGLGISSRIRMLPAAVQGDINPVLPATDVLVTDFSSIAFDFALLGRPIAFLAPDVDRYSATRGLYEPYRDFSGGSEVSTWSDVIALLANSAALARLARHAEALASKHQTFRDGRNTERVYEEVLTRLGKRE